MGTGSRPTTGHRRSLRLPAHDYAGHATYFITVCSADRMPLFGEVIEGTMRLSCEGQIVREEWQRSASLRSEIVLDAWVVMPNHLHALVLFTGDDGVASVSLPRPDRSLGALLAGFKSAVTSRIRAETNSPDAVVWQRNYYEYIVRGNGSLERIRGYIAANPSRWHLDRENDAKTGTDPFDTWVNKHL